MGLSLFDDRHRSEQNFTSFHTRDHFLRHANGRPQAAHAFLGKVALVKRSGTLSLTRINLRFATC
jgi:hypothetical protein